MQQPHFLITIADRSQFAELFQPMSQGDLKGYRESRVAFVGRSNVGKSSLLNRLLGVRLAQTSASPGKTRAIHCYRWPEAKKILVDLPGFGYAKASKQEQERWEEFITLYFRADEKLTRVLVLLDARHGPTASDLQALAFFRAAAIPMTLVFVKVDTLKTQSQRALRRAEVKQWLAGWGVPQEDVFWVSSVSGKGLEELRKALIAMS